MAEPPVGSVICAIERDVDPAGLIFAEKFEASGMIVGSLPRL